MYSKQATSGGMARACKGCDTYVNGRWCSFGRTVAPPSSIKHFHNIYLFSSPSAEISIMSDQNTTNVTDSDTDMLSNKIWWTTVCVKVSFSKDRSKHMRKILATSKVWVSEFEQE